VLQPNRQAIAAIATAAGRGAVGIVRVSGPRLTEIIAGICHRELPPREAVYLGFQDGEGGVIDRGLALYFPGPHSYTGEDVLELQAHGGPVVLKLLLARCLALGSNVSVRLARPGEFTERAFLNDKIDLTQAEAIADLIDASTEAAARSASRSLTGEFSKEVHRLRDALIHLRMLVEATLDVPEEEIDFLQKADAQGQLDRLALNVADVLSKATQGALLREGIKVVIAGQPNAGKSSLLNALAGAELAIVTPIAGTTRDRIEQSIQIDGVPVHVIDTAGLRDSDDAVESIGIARAWDAIADADAVLFIHDLTRIASTEYLDADAAIAARLTEQLRASTPVIDVWNKCDAAPLTSQGAGIALSTHTGYGLSTLRQRLLDAAGWQPSSGGLFIARERHVQALLQIQRHLQNANAHLRAQAQSLDLLAEELRLAQNGLGDITGEFTSDDLLGVIFSKFCIGK
jgi:tRNA modification GTPase